MNKVLDIVCYGEICSALHHADSIIHIAFITDSKLPDKTLSYIGSSLDQRGFIFKIYQHKIRFHVFKSSNPIGPNWSVIHNCWNIEPVFREFSYTLDEFLDIYMKTDHNLHQVLDKLEKDDNGFYTEQSQKTIENYFDTLKEKSFKARYESTEKEYSLDWNLWRALNLFKVPQHYLELVTKAECYALEGNKNSPF